MISPLNNASASFTLCMFNDNWIFKVGGIGALSNFIYIYIKYINYYFKKINKIKDKRRWIYVNLQKDTIFKKIYEL